MIRPLSMVQFAAACNGSISNAPVDVMLSGLAIDSRAVVPGDLFVAISGQHVDGHHYIDAAAEKGAAAVLTQRKVDSPIPQITAVNTEAALAEFGAQARAAYNGVLVGVTGSAGKTTAKNLIAAVLSEAGNVLATQGNRNNELGVPLTLAALSPNTEFAVLEMGAGKPGDIAHLRAIARPTVAVLLNVAEAHIEHYGSIDAIAETKGAILDELSENNIAIINGDQRWAEEWRERAAPARVLSYGLGPDVDYRAVDIALENFSGSTFTIEHPRGRCDVELKLPGMPGVLNALVAFAVGDALGVSTAAILKGLLGVKPESGRGRMYRLTEDRVLVDDSYNANPASVRAAIDALAGVEGHSCLVLGAMLELGDVSDERHTEMGAYALERGINRLWVVGERARAAVDGFGGGSRFAHDWQALVDEFHELPKGSTVLVKASRGAALDRLVAAWREGERSC